MSKTSIEVAVNENVQPSTMKKYMFTLEDQVRVIRAEVDANSEEEALAKVEAAFPQSDYGQEDVDGVQFSFDYEEVADLCGPSWICQE